MEDNQLSVFVFAFESAGFTGSINWYRNLDRNWHFMADVTPIIHQPALMIYGEHDTIPKSENLKKSITIQVRRGLAISSFVIRSTPA
jgi:pimeloyl-ACP methyl ester carboxylesterase